MTVYHAMETGYELIFDCLWHLLNSYYVLIQRKAHKRLKIFVSVTDFSATVRILTGYYAIETH